MALSDSTYGGGADSEPAMAVSVSAQPLDTKHAAAEIMKAIEAKDANALEDALELFIAACEDKYRDKGDDQE